MKEKREKKSFILRKLTKRNIFLNKNVTPNKTIFFQSFKTKGSYQNATTPP